MKFSAIFSFVLLATGAAAAMPEHKTEVRKTPGLLRFYTFEEGNGEEVVNHHIFNPGQLAVTGGPLGSLSINRIPPNGVNIRSSHGEKRDLKTFFPARWTSGRFPGKGAVVSAFDGTGLWRSGLTGREFANGGTIAGWVRPRPAGTGAGANIVSLGDAYKTGFNLGYLKSSSLKNGGIHARFGGPEHAEVVAGSVPEKEWTNFAVTFGAGELVLYLNGKKVAGKPFRGPPVPVFIGELPLCVPFHEYSGGRFGEYLHIQRNAKFNPQTSAFVDLDELTFFERPLTASEIAKLYETGKPAASPEQQRAAFDELSAREAFADSIQVKMDHRTNDYFRITEPVPVTISVPAKAGKLTAAFELETLYGKPLAAFERTVSPDAPLVEAIKTNQCGVFYLNITLRDAAGKIVKTMPDKYCFAVVPPRPTELSVHNPMGFWAQEDDFYYDAPLRRLHVIPWPQERMKHFKKYYQLYRSQIPNFRPFIWFYARYIREKSPEDRPFNRAMFKEIIDFMKDKPMLGFEVSSEPPTTLDPQWYVQALADLREIADAGGLKHVPIVPPGGSPPSIPMIAAILRAGGHKYMDGISYHPYTASPIGTFLRENPTRRLRDVMAEYPDKKLVLWNTECGMGLLPRVKGRPMSSKDAHAARFPSNTHFGQEFFLDFTSRVPEDESAALLSQAILLDMVNGYQTYVFCGSPNLNGLPSLRGVAYTAISGQILNYKVKVSRLPLAVLEQMCVLIDLADGSRIAALFATRAASVRLRLKPDTTYKTMDMLGNFGTRKTDADGMLRLEIGKAPVYLFHVPKDLAEVVTLKLTAPEKLPENRILNAEATVMNPFRHQLTGTLEALPIKGAELKLAKTKIDLAPGATEKIALTLTASALRRKLYTLGLLLRDQTGRELGTAETLFDSAGVIRMVPRARRAIRLDGDETEWAKIPAETSEDVETVVHGKPNFAEVWVPQWRGKDDLSFTVKTAWRKNDGIYFLLKVRDDVLQPAPADKTGLAFRYDCLELFFDGRPANRLGTLISEGADQTIVIPATGETIAPCKLYYARRDREHIRVECVGKKIPGGYLIEGKIAPNDRSAFKVEAGSQFRMDFLIDDTDELATARLRKSALALHGLFNNYNNSNLWGRYELSLD